MRIFRRGSPLLSLIGAVLGGFLGDIAFGWILEQGFYALALPGAGIGIGCSLLSRGPSLVRGILCGLAAIPLGLYSEWSRSLFLADASLGYFLTHFYDLKPITLGFLGLGGLLSFWFARGYLGSGSRAEPEPRETEQAKRTNQ